jgi:hypothetical protein
VFFFCFHYSTHNSGGYEMASKPKTFDSETVALACAPLLVISEMDKVQPGSPRAWRSSSKQKRAIQGRSGRARVISTVTYGFDAKGRD